MFPSFPLEETRSSDRSRSPVLARAIAMELHVLPQGDRIDIQKLHDSVQRGGLEIADRVLERLSTTPVVSEDVKNFQALVTNLKNEARQLKAVAHFNLFDALDVVDARTDRLARHRDGTPFVSLSDGHHTMSTRLAHLPKRFSFLLNF